MFTPLNFYPVKSESHLIRAVGPFNRGAVLTALSAFEVQNNKKMGLTGGLYWGTRRGEKALGNEEEMMQYLN